MAFDKIYNELINLNYERKSSYDRNTYTTEVVNKDAREVFRIALSDALRGQFNEYEAKIAGLEAKVFAYEAIISNSNFKPMLTDQYKDSDPDKEG